MNFLLPAVKVGLDLSDPIEKFNPLLPVEKAGFDPGQPRDLTGKWTETGAGVRAFHGTMEENLKSILANGLTVNPGWRNFLGDQLYAGPRGEAIFVANRKATALWYAKQAYFNKGEDSEGAVVLELSVPKKVFAQFRNDEEHYGTGAAYVSYDLKPEWITGVFRLKKDGLKDKLVPLKVRKADGVVVVYLVLDLSEWGSVEKAGFDPNQPRDRTGKWSEAGSGDLSAGAKELRDFLQMIAQMRVGTTTHTFKLEHGREFKFDEHTFVGGGEPKQCFMNAGRLALGMEDNPPEGGPFTYVEGEINVHGVPLDHAWVIDANGRTIDPTIADPKGIRAYFGVPIKTEFLLKTVLKTKAWGLFGHRGRRLVLEADPKEVVAKKYSPDQPRAPAGTPTGGQWVETGVGEEIGPAQKLLLQNQGPDLTLEEVLSQFPPDVLAKLEAARKGVSEGVPTTALEEEGGHMEMDGTYTLERQTLHAKILELLFGPEKVNAALPVPGEAPVLVMTGGRPGAGKTTSLRVGHIEFPGHIYISADVIQESLPGYKPHLAGLFNPEAQDIAAQAERIARRAGLNIVFDVTMKSKLPALERVKVFKDAGYKVEGYFTHTTPAVSARRAVERFLSTKRYVPPEVSFASRTNERTFDSLIPRLDKWALFDNNGAQPKVVAQGGSR